MLCLKGNREQGTENVLTQKRNAITPHTLSQLTFFIFVLRY